MNIKMCPYSMDEQSQQKVNLQEIKSVSIVFIASPHEETQWLCSDYVFSDYLFI